ncbi:MAG: VWA domain-containing protein, partial [Armatimonadetes bacterium]|nr:VWA domain-containing protein [Armatimonadota bacterium]
MRLLNPAALALLLLLPILLLLYMLRARRQDVVVSATLLWRRAQVDLLATRPLRRLERSLLLLLQLLIVGLLVLAAARPLVPWPGGSGEALIVVMDVSASMQATDVPPSRFEAARRDALALVERLRPGEEGMIIAAGRAPEVAAVFTGDRRALARTLRALTVTDGEARVADALALAAAHRRGRAARIVAFTDGTEPVPPSVVAEVRRFGRSGDNVGIVAMRAAPGLRGETHVVIRVHNAGGAPRQVPLTVLADGRPVTTQRLALPAGETRGIALTLPPPAPARMQAVIEAADLLAADNIAYAAAERAPLPA